MTGVIILAAGKSGRLGTPKQTLQLKGKSLIKRSVETALNSVCRPVILVLGANYHDILAEVEHEPVIIVYNPDWAEGMASSIRCGINSLQEDKNVDGAIIMLCDQPFVDTAILNQLVKKRETDKKDIIACFYGGNFGVPVLFGRSLFAQLLELKGKEGAKKILIAHQQNVATVKFPLGVVDIDTNADYEALKNQK